MIGWLWMRNQCPYAEIETETGFRNVVAAIAATLRPSAVIALPIGGAILLPGGVFLPSALRTPTGLSLPSLRLLLAALGRAVAALLSGRCWLLLAERAGLVAAVVAA